MLYLVTMESLETGLLPLQQNAQIIERINERRKLK